MIMKCFVIALKNEAEPVLSAMENVTETSAYGKKIYTGRLYGMETAVVLCGVGKANAASAAQLAIDRFSPEAIINVGNAGGLCGDMRAGDIYAVSAAVQYDFDLTQPNGGAPGTLDEFEENYLPLSVAAGFMTVKCGTGDRFNDSREDFLLLTEVLGAQVREMELGAIAQVCVHAGVKCYAFKAVSDVAGSGSTTEQYRANLQKCALALSGALEKIVKGSV